MHRLCMCSLVGAVLESDIMADYQHTSIFSSFHFRSLAHCIRASYSIVHLTTYTGRYSFGSTSLPVFLLPSLSNLQALTSLRRADLCHHVGRSLTSSPTAGSNNNKRTPTYIYPHVCAPIILHLPLKPDVVCVSSTRVFPCNSRSDRFSRALQFRGINTLEQLYCIKNASLSFSRPTMYARQWQGYLFVGDPYGKRLQVVRVLLRGCSVRK